MTTASVSDVTSPDPAGVMVGLLNSFVTVQAIHAVAVLGVADLLADGPASVDSLAAATSTDATSLHRVMRMLAGQGVFAEEPDGRFSSTSLGDLLQSANPLGVHDWAIYAGSAAPWAAWGQLTNSLRTGEPGFVLAHGMPTYEYLPLHPELGASFDRWMTNQSRHHNQAIVSVFDFSVYRCIVDVGGGKGSTLAAILGAHTKIRGVLFDLPTVVAARDLATSTYGSRCEVIGGNMLDGVPPGGDIYLLKRSPRSR